MDVKRRVATQPELITPLPGPRASAIVQRDQAAISPSYTRGYPFVMARGKGIWVWDVDGNRFLDFNAGVAVCSTGHCHPKVVRALQKQSELFLHYSGTDFYYEVEVELGERLARLAPVLQPAKVFFCNSGAEAVEGAIKLARYRTGRPYLVSFHGAFHGRTMGALSLTSSKTVHRRGFGPFLPGTLQAPYADCYRCPLGEAPRRCATACLRYLEERVLGRGIDPQEVAAIFVEAIQGEGGYILPAPGFLAGLRELCDRHGILLVADEIQSGMGRTGRMFAIEHEGVRPDIVVIAKGVASGLPLGAIVAPADVMSWPPGTHGSTFGGNPLACAAGLATLDLLEGGFIRNADKMGHRLLRGLRRIAKRYPQVGDARGRGLMCALDFVLDHTNLEPNVALRDAVVNACFHRGLLVLGAGPSAMRLCPPLTVRSAEIDVALEIIDEAIAECTGGALDKPSGEVRAAGGEDDAERVERFDAGERVDHEPALRDWAGDMLTS